MYYNTLMTYKGPMTFLSIILLRYKRSTRSPRFLCVGIDVVYYVNEFHGQDQDLPGAVIADCRGVQHPGQPESKFIYCHDSCIWLQSYYLTPFPDSRGIVSKPTGWARGFHPKACRHIGSICGIIKP